MSDAPLEGMSPRVWNDNLEELMQRLFEMKEHAFWCSDWDVKYLNVRIDTRDNGYVLQADGRGNSSNMKNTFLISPDKVFTAMDKYREMFPMQTPLAESDTVEGLKSSLDTAMKLLRDNKSNMHFDRELNQADHDVLKQARKWK